VNKLYYKLVLLRFHTGRDQSVLVGFWEKTEVSVGFGFLTTTKTSCKRLVITCTPAAKRKLQGWSSDGTLLMRREKGRESR